MPVTRPQTVDSCLLILRDWSDGITLADTEIEKERGVIEEEWRTYGVQSQFTKDALPYQRFTLTMQLDTDSAKYEKLVPILFAELKNISDNGPRPEDVQESKEYFLKVLTHKLQTTTGLVSRQKSLCR